MDLFEDVPVLSRSDHVPQNSGCKTVPVIILQSQGQQLDHKIGIKGHDERVSHSDRLDDKYDDYDEELCKIFESVGICGP